MPKLQQITRPVIRHLAGSVRRHRAIRIDGRILRSVVTSRPTYVVLATEAAVRRTDSNGRQYWEALLMNGMEMRRAGQDHIPLVDNGNSDSVQNVLGSVRDLRTGDGKLFGRLEWAGDAEAQKIKARFDGGHLQHFSIRYRPLEIIDVAAGQVYEGVAGPAEIVTRWNPLEAWILSSPLEQLTA